MPEARTDEREHLDRRLDQGRLKPRHVRAVGKALAAVHALAPLAPEHGGEPAPLLRIARGVLDRLRERDIIAAPEAGALEYRIHRILTHDIDALLDRHAEGRVRRIATSIDPREIRVRGSRASIASTAPPAGADTAMALASLSSLLRVRRDTLAAERLLAAYALASDDYSVYGVIECFETLAACVRAAGVADPAESRRALGPWLGEARALPTPTLIVLVGGVATGKSTLAKALFPELRAPRVVADRVRAATLDAIADRAGTDAALDRAWSTAFDDRLYVAMLLRARSVLESGRSCVIDSCSPRRSHRLRSAELAEALGAHLVLCTCEASAARVRERLELRDGRDDVTPGDWGSLAERLATSFEPVEDDEPGIHVQVSTDVPGIARDRVVATVLAPARRSAAIVRPAPGWPTAVTFDCWKTLLEERDWKQAHSLRVDALCAAVREDGAELDRAIVSDAFDAAWQRHMDRWQAGIHSGAREVARWSLEQLGLPLPEMVVEHLTERFQTASHTSAVDGLEGARETLTALHEAGVALALVCDTGLTPGRVVRRHLDRNGLLELLAACRFSDEVGVPKPDRRIFQSALDALGARPEQSIHVGDLHRTDVEGARAIGMGTIRITAAHDDAIGDREPSREADAVVGSHAELLGTLRSWVRR